MILYYQPQNPNPFYPKVNETKDVDIYAEQDGISYDDESHFYTVECVKVLSDVPDYWLRKDADRKRLFRHYAHIQLPSGSTLPALKNL